MGGDACGLCSGSDPALCPPPSSLPVSSPFSLASLSSLHPCCISRPGAVRPKPEASGGPGRGVGGGGRALPVPGPGPCL
jgi:hypothetical protein